MGDRRGEAWTLHRLSETWSGVHYRRELDHLRRAHDLFAASRDPWGRSVAAHDLAYLLSMTGGPEYRTWHARARRLAENEGDVRSRAALARTEGYAAFYRGRAIDAIDAMALAQPLAARAGDRYAEADAVLIRAEAEAAVGEPDAAEASAEELLGFAKDLGSDRLRVVGLLVGARAAQRSGRRAIAGRRLAAADRLLRREGMAVMGAWAVGFRALHDLDRGDFGRTSAAAGRIGASAKRFGWDLSLPLVPLLRGRVAFGRGRLSRAVTEFATATDLARRVGADGTQRLAALLGAQSSVLLGRPAAPVRPLPEDPEHHALAAELRGVRELVRGRPDRADDAFAEAIEVWRTLGWTCWLGRALGLRAAGRRAAGRDAEAVALVAEARRALSTVGTPRGERAALLAPAP
jgi:tetratricopeptide (TPR) repeat protein